MKSSTGFFVVMGLVITGALAFIFMPELQAAVTGKKPATDGNGGNGSPGGNGGTGGGTGGGGVSTTGSLDYNKNLYNGISGAEVKELQLRLNRKETANPLVADGKFGPLTTQKLYRLTNQQSITLNTAWSVFGLY